MDGVNRCVVFKRRERFLVFARSAWMPEYRLLYIHQSIIARTGYAFFCIHLPDDRIWTRPTSTIRCAKLRTYCTRRNRTAAGVRRASDPDSRYAGQSCPSRSAAVTRHDASVTHGPLSPPGRCNRSGAVGVRHAAFAEQVVTAARNCAGSAQVVRGQRGRCVTFRVRFTIRETLANRQRGRAEPSRAELGIA